MKPQPYRSLYSKPPTSPTRSLLMLLTLALIVIFFVMFATSCSQIQSIPFSVSYTDESGDTFTITKLAQPQIHPSK